jgi:hypothetical protein
LTSLSNLARSFKNKKIDATKRRRQIENKLKSVLSLKRRSSSGLSSLERRKEDSVRKKEEIAQLLNQHLAQRDSIKRLKISAEERLRQEQEARDQVQQQSEYSEPAERTSALERLKMIDDKIGELESEIKQRSLAENRLVKTIADLEKQKTRIDTEIRKQIRSKPLLLEQLKSSTKTESSLRPRVQSLIKREGQASRDLSKIMQKLRLVQEVRRKAQRKAAAKRRAAAQRRAAAKRKAAAKRAAAKRKAATKRKAKKRAKIRTRKASKRKAKRKASKKSKRSRR